MPCTLLDPWLALYLQSEIFVICKRYTRPFGYHSNCTNSTDKDIVRSCGVEGVEGVELPVKEVERVELSVIENVEDLL